MFTKICLNCNTEFETSWSNSKYCSRRCSNEARVKNLNFGNAVCLYCGKPVKKKAEHQCFCSRSHACAYRRKLKQKDVEVEIHNICSVCNCEITGDFTTICRECYTKNKSKNIAYYYVGEKVNGNRTIRK